MTMKPTVAFLFLLCGAVAAGAEATSAGSDQAEPEIARLEVFPAELKLHSAEDLRRVVVTGFTADGRQFDLTRKASLTATDERITVEAGNVIRPQASGQTSVVVKAAGKSATVPVLVVDATRRPVDFITDVLPVLSKVGCNQGACHGSQKGKAGFKLSLRGYDPLFDYRSLVDDLSGRRFNRAQPEQSLLLLKPTQGVPHEGGFLFDEKSPSYAVLRRWIAEGCRYEANSARVSRISVYPAQPLLPSPAEARQLVVTAHFPDGSTRDVTGEAVYETTDFEVATVNQAGLVEGVRSGDAAALVRYEGQYAAAPITIIGERPGYSWPETPEYNFVDTHVNSRLKRARILPAELCTDAEFLRRVSLDLTGIPPSIEQSRAFLADERPSHEKRTAKIDELLASPDFVDFWTLKWCDLLLVNRKFLSEKGVWAFRNWIRHQLAVNRPYDEFVHDLMTARGSTFVSPAASYFRVTAKPQELMENMTQVFIGTRFQCNQCHDHPFERWTQQQYYELSAFFTGVQRKSGYLPDEQVIFDRGGAGSISHPGTGQMVTAAFPYTWDGAPERTGSLRHQLADWLTAGGNPYFARSLVNRYWSYFFGRGIIDPVDDIRASNPPTNPELLAALEADFLASDFDMRRLVRTIVSSHTYQRSYRTSEWNRDDRVNFSHALPRRLSAEQLYDAITIATGSTARIPGVPVDFRATQLPDPKVRLSFLDMFGRPPRESPCECERSSDVSLGQTLNLVNGQTISAAIVDPNGLIARRLKEQATTEQLVDDVYLSVLCRLPATAAVAYMKEVGQPGEAAEDLMWALINSPAFLFNR